MPREDTPSSEVDTRDCRDNTESEIKEILVQEKEVVQSCASLENTKSNSTIKLWNEKFEELLELQREAQDSCREDEESVRDIVREMSVKMKEQFDALSHKESVLRKEQRKLAYLQNELVSIIRQMSLTEKKLSAVRSEQFNQQKDLAMLLEKDVKRFEVEVSKKDPLLYSDYERIHKQSKPEKSLQTFLRQIQHKQTTLKKFELLTYKRLAACREGAPPQTGAGTVTATPTSGVLTSAKNSKKFEFTYPANIQLTGCGLTPAQRYKKIVDGIVSKSDGPCEQNSTQQRGQSTENNNNNVDSEYHRETMV